MHAGLRSGTAVWTVKTKLWHFSTVMVQCESSSNLFVWNHVGKVSRHSSVCQWVWTSDWSLDLDRCNIFLFFFLTNSDLQRVLSSIHYGAWSWHFSFISWRDWKMLEFWLFFCPMTIVRQHKQIYTYSCTDDFEFRVCKSMHHHTFNWINQQDAATSQVYYLFRYSSTCLGHPRAHHQELQLQ